MMIIKIDHETNSQKTQVYDCNIKNFINVLWKDLKVGHIIKVERDEIVPADIIVLEAMDQNHICYVDESSLTGVFDRFVIKKACNDTRSPVMKQVNVNDYIKNIKGMLKYNQPNMELRQFSARLKLESYPRANDISLENFINRGSSLKNTKFIYGLVVYTGMECKIMQVLKANSKNSNELSGKKERNYLFTTFGKNQYIYTCFFIVLILIYITNCIFKYRKLVNKSILIPYIENDDSMNREDFFYIIYQFTLTIFLTFPYIWYNMIYISYYILSLFIEYDVKVRLSSKNKTEMINIDCLADYGHVKYILADKTGTITNRKFDLKALCIKSNFYLLDRPEKNDEGLFSDENYDGIDVDYIREFKTKINEDDEIKKFIEELSLNHSVTTWINSNPNSKDSINTERKIGSSFGEEKAVMKVLEIFGYNIKKASDKKLDLEINNKLKSYTILGRNHYSRIRKCSSLIYRDIDSDSDESILLCKGYDLTMLDKLALNHDKNIISSIAENIKNMSSLGYRFVILLRKNLSSNETKSFIENYKSAESNMLQREVLLENLAKETEQNLELVGSLFFEESFNNNVKFALNKLNMADIHTWIVSGDRSENVEALARNLDIVNCNQADILYLSEKDHLEDIDGKINSILLTLHKKTKGNDLNIPINEELKKTIVVFIHGRAMSAIIKNNKLYQQFALLLIHIKYLFGSNFSAKNKSDLAIIMKKFLCKKCKLLAIGDGLNDVMMLKESDLAIGIRSREILQLKGVCDLIVSSFAQITDLILVHGTWNLERIKNIIYFSLYANLILIFPILLQISLSEIFIMVQFNYIYLMLILLIMNICIIFVFCFNNHLDRSLISISPHVVAENFLEKELNVYNLLKTILMGVFDSYLIYYLFFMISNDLSNSVGFTADIHIFWISYTICSLLLIYLKLLVVELHSINVINFFILIICSIGSLIIGYYDEETFDSIKQYLSFFIIQVYVMGVFMFCLFYSLVIKYYKIFFEESVSGLLNQYFNYAISELKFLTNFEDFTKFMTEPIFPKERTEYSTVEDVIIELSKENKFLDSSIENCKKI